MQYAYGLCQSRPCVHDHSITLQPEEPVMDVDNNQQEVCEITFLSAAKQAAVDKWVLLPANVLNTMDVRRCGRAR
jgi:hypothetical protein